MSETSMTTIFNLLPEEEQQRALLDSLEFMFAKDEYGAIDELLTPIQQIRGHDIFKAHALSVGVKCSLRRKNYDVAFERYHQIARVGENQDISEILGYALHQLSIYLLPGRATEIFNLWRPLISPDMQMSLQNSLAEVGVMLARAFSRNRNNDQAGAVKQVMQENLPPALWNKLSHKFK